MIFMIQYLLEASVALVVLYLPFLLIARQTTFHRTNRFVLLLSVWVSLLLPFVNFSLPTVSMGIPIVFLKEIVVTANGQGAVIKGMPLRTLLFPGYLFISGCFFLLFLRKVLLYLLKIGQAEIIRQKGYTLVITRQQTSPFSFFGYIFCNPSNHTCHALDIILQHEKVHISEHHYLDLIFLELVQVLFWFHPVLYLCKRSLKSIHEYQADQKTMQYTDRSHYLRLLYSESFRPQQFGLAHNFSYSPLKKRLKMMIKTPTNRYAGLLYFSWLPVIALLILFLGTNQVQAQNEAGSKQVAVSVKNGQEAVQPSSSSPRLQEQEEEVFLVVDKLPQFPGGEQERMKFLSTNLSYPEKAKQDSVQGTVYITFIIEKDGSITHTDILRGIDPLLDEEALRVIHLMPAWIPGELKGNKVRVRFTIPIQFKLK
ncbi:MAG: M56 family metallopeptidase [Bacteroidales bacterium]|nr:M56 family metallopeptidase [Bacteroidales bacterium]